MDLYSEKSAYQQIIDLFLAHDQEQAAASGAGTMPHAQFQMQPGAPPQAAAPELPVPPPLVGNEVGPAGAFATPPPPPQRQPMPHPTEVAMPQQTAAAPAQQAFQRAELPPLPEGMQIVGVLPDGRIVINTPAGQVVTGGPGPEVTPPQFPPLPQ